MKAAEEKLAAANQSALTAGSVQVSWGIDFEELADAVTFKLDEMERKLGEQKGSDLQTYRCPQCKLAISELDVDFNALLTEYETVKNARESNQVEDAFTPEQIAERKLFLEELLKKVQDELDEEAS